MNGASAGICPGNKIIFTTHQVFQIITVHIYTGYKGYKKSMLCHHTLFHMYTHLFNI